MDKLQLIKILLKNRMKIYYVISLKQAQTEEEKSLIIDKMERDIDNKGPEILQEFFHKDLAKDWTQKRANEISNRTREEGRKLKNETKSSISQVSNVFSGISSVTVDPQEKIDLDKLAFAQVSSTITSGWPFNVKS